MRIQKMNAKVWYRYKGTWIKWQYDAWVLIVMVMITCIVDKLHGPSKHSMLMYIYDDTCAYYIIHLSSHEESPAKKMKRTSLHPVVSALRPSLPKGSEHLWASFPKQSLHFWCALLRHRDVRHCYRKFMENQEDSTWVKSSSLWQRCSLRIMAMSHQSPTT